MKFLKSKKSASDGKVFRSGLYSAAITAAVIAAVVLLNLLVRAIPSKYTEFDLSELQTGGRRSDAGCDHLLSGPDRQ